MPQFSYIVDRVYKVVSPVSVHPDVGLMSEPFTLEAGAQIVYRGLVELGGTSRHVFDVGEGKKAYSRDRAALDPALEEDYGELIRP